MKRSLMVVTLAAWSCTKHQPKVQEPVAPAPKSAPAAPAPPPLAAVPPPPDVCRVVSKLTSEPPFYLEGRGLVVTRILKPCVTRDGQRGYEKGTPWLAMGFPCTGGNGQVELKGNHYHAPKMVSFVLSTDCSMMPSSKEAAETAVRAVLDLPEEARLMALTPFVVQYWELPGMPDADTGISVELRSTPALDGLWKKFRENEPISVRLYGRENAWVQGGHFYLVDATINMTARKSFKLTVNAVKSLAPDELEQVKERCNQLRPQRDCDAVF